MSAVNGSQKRKTQKTPTGPAWAKVFWNLETESWDEDYAGDIALATELQQALEPSVQDLARQERNVLMEKGHYFLAFWVERHGKTSTGLEKKALLLNRTDLATPLAVKPRRLQTKRFTVYLLPCHEKRIAKEEIDNWLDLGDHPKKRRLPGNVRGRGHKFDSQLPELPPVPEKTAKKLAEIVEETNRLQPGKEQFVAILSLLQEFSKIAREPAVRALNAYLEQAPQDTFAQKQEIFDLVSAFARATFAEVLSPRSASVSRLALNVEPASPEGRFSFSIARTSRSERVTFLRHISFRFPVEIQNQKNTASELDLNPGPGR